MKNYLEVEKHPNGTQVYLNDKPFAWFKSNEENVTARIDDYAASYRAEIINTKAKITSRHYKLCWDCSVDELKSFYRAVASVVVSGAIFRAGIGEFYLSVRGVDSSREEIETIEDVLHKFRRQIRIERNLSGKPKPERRWRGIWIDLKKLISADHSPDAGNH